MFKGPSCLVMHIQSCRLKQTAICMPLGGWDEGGWRVGCRGKHHSSSRHPAEYSLCGALNVSVFPPTVTVRESQSQSNHSNQGLVVPSRLGNGCQNKRVNVQRWRWPCDSLVLADGCSDHLLDGRSCKNNSSSGQERRWGCSTRTR